MKGIVKKSISLALSSVMAMSGFVPMAVKAAAPTTSEANTLLSKDGISARIGIVSDSHINKHDGTTLAANPAARALNNALKTFKAQSVDGLALNGDITYMVNNKDWGYSTAEDISDIPYKVLKEALTENGFYDTATGKLADNVVYATGNHEFPQSNNEANVGEASLDMFTKEMGIEQNRDKKIKGYHFISSGGDTYNSKLTAEKEKWILDTIDAAHTEDANKPVFLTLHHPIHNTVKGSDTAAGAYTENFKAELNKRPYVIMFTAHAHVAEQNPQVVWQDGFTAIQTAAIAGSTVWAEGYSTDLVGSNLQAASYSQGMMIDITTDNVVKVHRIDFKSGKIFGEPIVIDVKAGAEGFKYKNRTATAPTFAQGAGITVADKGDNNIKISFPKADIGAEGNLVAEGYVNRYRVEAIKEVSGNSVLSKDYLSDYYKISGHKTSFDLNITGLEPAEKYTIKVTPISCLGGEGTPLTVSAKTTGTKPPKESVTKELNVALNKPVQDSASNASNPQNAVDGNMDTRWTPGEKKKGIDKHWWSVDLGREFNVKRIEIYDGNEEWVQHRTNLVVEGATKADFSDAVTIDSIGDAASNKYVRKGCWTINLEKNFYRYIRIRRTNAQNWCPYFKEVQVFADVTLVELLKGKPAYASKFAGTEAQYGAAKAVDGDESTSWLAYCDGEGTGDYPYWYVDMENEYSVDYIEYINTSTFNETWRAFDIIGNNSPLTAAVGTDEHKFVSSNITPKQTAFQYSGAVSSPEAYRYLGYRKTYDYGGANITELKAYSMMPDVSKITLSDSGVSIRFSEAMKDETLNPDEIKVYDLASGNAIDYTATDCTSDGQTYTINKPLEQGKAYKVTVSNEVASAKNSTFADTYQETIINGDLAEYGDDVYEKKVLANVAQFKPVTTSVEAYSDAFSAEKANDGLVDGSYWNPTDQWKDSSDKHVWWSVDLGRDYKIKQVEVYDGNNSWDMHRRNLVVEGATKSDYSDAVPLDSIGNTADNEKYPANGCWTVKVDNGAYRYIRVRRTDSQNYCPHFREIKVFAEQTVTEVSRNKPVTSDCQYNDIHAASKANDGINLTSANTAWCRAWSNEPSGACWWRVDLENAYYIDYFEIEARLGTKSETDVQRSNFELRGTNASETDTATFDSAQKLSYLGAKGSLHALQADPFPIRGMWTSSASSNIPYRYIVWRSTSEGASSGLAEIRACVVNPEIYAFTAKDNKIDITFSDNMLGITLSPETIKVYNEAGAEVAYTDYTVGQKTYTINNITLTSGQKYTVEILGGARNEKLVPVAKMDSKKEFTYGKGYDIESFKTTDNIDTDGANFGSFKEGGRYEAKARINNYSGVELAASLITAIYDNGRLVDAKTTDKTIANGATASIKSELDIPAAATNKYSAKSFLWDSDSFSPLAEAQEGTMQNLFNKDVINMTPSYTQTDETNVAGLTSIYYDALPYEGNPTKVYAYYGIPEHEPGEKVPGVVLVHGGGGTAYSNWVKAWNERGYAAIAMDLGGNTPTDANGTKYKHENAGPAQCTYGDLYKDIKDTWMYHAVADVMLAHNILRSFEDVDSSKIGISGVSWGGVVTTTTLGVDNRFAFAVPIYGCGHLYESETYFSDTLAPKSKYIDPAYYAKRSTLPILFVNDDTDYHFSTTITTKTYEDVASHAAISFLPETPHAQETAQAMKEPYAFADSIVKGGASLIKITSAEVLNGNITVTYDTNGRTVAKAYLRYNNDETFTYAGNACTSTWANVEGTADNGTVTIEVPADCKHFYVSIVDTDENTVSTKQFIN